MTTRHEASVLLLAVLVFGGACRPTLDDRPWLVTHTQIVAWKAEPPEATPGKEVSLQVVALSPAGAPDTAETAWTLCHTPKPLDENRIVTPTCLNPSTVDAVGDTVRVMIPPDACRVFGPDTPQPATGAPPTRPRDPDATGGYYQPVTIALGTSLAVGLERITCDLPDASLLASRAFQAAYRANQNPAISSLGLSVDGAAVDPMTIPAGARLRLQVTWLAESAETYPTFDRASGSVIQSQETIRASWFVTGGQLDPSGAEGVDPQTLSTGTIWEAPGASGTFEIVVVLRDSRGGAAVARSLLVVP